MRHNADIRNGAIRNPAGRGVDALQFSLAIPFIVRLLFWIIHGLIQERVGRFVVRADGRTWLRLTHLDSLFAALHLNHEPMTRLGGRNSIGQYFLVKIRQMFSYGEVEVEEGELATEPAIVDIDYSTTGGRCAGTRRGQIIDSTVVYIHHSLHQRDCLMESLNLVTAGNVAQRRAMARREAERRAEGDWL